MFKYNLISTIRHLLKRPFFLFINVSGLTLGVLISTILSVYVYDELSVDSGLAKSEDTYRLLRKSSRNGESYRIGVTSAPFAPAIASDYPQDIVAALRVLPSDGLVTITNDSHFNEDKFFLADSNFFAFFQYEFVYGDESTAFAQPQSVVLTEEIATQYFGDENPLNKTIKLDQSFEFTVTGVIKKSTHKSQLDFNMISTIDVLHNFNFFNEWWSNGLITYLQLNPTTEVHSFEAGLPLFMDKHFGEDFKESGLRTDLTLQAFEEVYFGNDVQYDQYKHGNLDTVYLFLVVGLFIVMIACINFMNISTALASMRAKEVGVKKIMGSNKAQLMAQYLLESLIICSASVLLGFMLVEILLPSFNSIYGLHLTIDWLDIRVIGYGFAIIGFLVLVSGIYPAFLLSSFQPLKVLKGQASSGSQSANWVRKGLVVFQFACSIILLITTAVIWQQMNFVMNKPLGFDKSHVVMIRNNNRDMQSNLDLFVDRVAQVSGVKSVAKIGGEPGGFHDTMNFKIEGEDETVRMRTTFSDAMYLQCFGIELASGRFFHKDSELDRASAMVINETSAKILGHTNESVLGLRIQNLYTDSTYREVVGVVKDYNFSSLKREMEPLAIAPSDYINKVAIKLDARDISSTLSGIQGVYEGMVDIYPYEYKFLDQRIGDLYAEEQTQQQIFMLFSLISILIGSLGIFGLATFTASQRAREISIRKVLGATVFNISYMLGNQFVKLVLIANVVAWPLAWYFMDGWLSGFAYSISLGLSSFIIALMIALIIAIVTVSYQSIKAGLVNPATTLRNE
jgi:putative ABC transport system permease protein